jgi:nitrite reductase/ring-hydroxylating ferredoxin subunit
MRGDYMRCPSCNGQLSYIIHDNKRIVYCPTEKKEFNLVDGKAVEIGKPKGEPKWKKNVPLKS